MIIFPTQSVVYEPATLASPGNLKVQNFHFHSRPYWDGICILIGDSYVH